MTGRRESFDAHTLRQGTPPPPALRAVRDDIAARVEQGAAARAWAGIPEPVRCMLVMLAIDPAGSVDAVALRPWGSFTQGQQAQIAALRRVILAGLAPAGALQ